MSLIKFIAPSEKSIKDPKKIIFTFGQSFEKLKKIMKKTIAPKNKENV